jgi:hypothetical protein
MLAASILHPHFRSRRQLDALTRPGTAVRFIARHLQASLALKPQQPPQDRTRRFGEAAPFGLDQLVNVDVDLDGSTIIFLVRTYFASWASATSRRNSTVSELRLISTSRPS